MRDVRGITEWFKAAALRCTSQALGSYSNGFEMQWCRHVFQSILKGCQNILTCIVNLLLQVRFGWTVFFLFFQTYEPHKPYRAPEEFIRRFRPSYDERKEHERVNRAVERWNRLRRVDSADSLLLYRHMFHCGFAGLPPLLDKPGFARANLSLGLGRTRVFQRKSFLKWLRNIYDAEIAYVDARIGELFDDLRSRGLYDQAVVILTSDHGEQFMERELRGHGHHVFNPEVHIPLILKAGGRRGEVTAAVSLVDINRLH